MTRKTKDWTAVDLRATYARYLAGESTTNLARELGVSSDALRKAFTCGGYPMKLHNRAATWTAKEVRAIYERYLAGESVDRLAAEFRVYPGAIRGQFKRSGLPMVAARRGVSLGTWTVTDKHDCIEAEGVCLLCDRPVMRSA